MLKKVIQYPICTGSRIWIPLTGFSAIIVYWNIGYRTIFFSAIIIHWLWWYGFPLLIYWLLRYSFLLLCPPLSPILAPCEFIGTTPISKHMFNSLTCHSSTAIPPFFKHSTGNPSSPGALPISFHSLPPLLPLTILLFQLNLPPLVSANYQLHWYLPPRHLPHSVPVQNTLPISSSPQHHHTIFRHSHHLPSHPFTFPHSLYHFPKQFLVTLKIIPQLLTSLSVHHSFLQL